MRIFTLELILVLMGLCGCISDKEPRMVSMALVNGVLNHNCDDITENDIVIISEALKTMLTDDDLRNLVNVLRDEEMVGVLKGETVTDIKRRRLLELIQQNDLLVVLQNFNKDEFKNIVSEKVNSELLSDMGDDS